MGWKPATLRAKLSPQIYPTALRQVQSVKHLRAWQQPLHQMFDLTGIPRSSINYGSSDVHVLHVCDGGTCLPCLWWRVSNREEVWEEVDISLKTLKLLLCFCLYKADLELFKWASVVFGGLERIVFAFHPPHTAVQPKQNVRSEQQPHFSAIWMFDSQQHPFALTMLTPCCSSLCRGMGAELELSDTGKPRGEPWAGVSTCHMSLLGQRGWQVPHRSYVSKMLDVLALYFWWSYQFT